ncbi:MAG: DUF2167 domain-containing protein [Rhodocyclaceae bacterium]|nr:DUF2167 domain-containing protein [Rhodocyclaceae bacterium]
MFRQYLTRLIAALTLAACTPAFADPAGEPPHSPLDQAAAAAQAAQIEGPTRVPLGEQATLDLPQGYAFIPQAEAQALMHAMGNMTGPGFYGLILGDAMSGFVSVSFNPAGYVKDDDAREWNAQELLQNLKDGTEAANEDRRARGIPEFEVVGWVEKPAYEATTHRLVWSAELRDKVVNPEHPAAGVNYNTYQLGREGYISMNLVSDLNNVEAAKPRARQLLTALQFNEGKRYADFDASTDKVAAYGLAALVGGVAAKKLGLLAVIGAFLAKFGKLGLLAAAGGLVGLKKLLGRKPA